MPGPSEQSLVFQGDSDLECNEVAFGCWVTAAF